MTNLGKNMLLTDGIWTDGTPTFVLISLTNDSPFIEAIFEPAKKALILLTKEKEDTFHMLPKLDESGEPLIRRDIKEGDKKNPYRQERVQMHTYHETVIRNKEDIMLFVEVMAINDDKSRIEKFF